ncbi:MAG: 7-carboxy-7-deazaguanine synthase QueE [Candidatus Aminicenantales bacterium]
MPPPPILKIAEVFPSFQGEGLRQGEATVFVRFSGCNLKCAFCDTKYAWSGGCICSPPQVMDTIKKIRRHFPAGWVCLTGGEPLLQDIAELVHLLKKEKLNIQMETNGTLYRPLAVDWYSLSPKPEKYFYQREYRAKAREVKLVITRMLTLDVIKKLRREFPSQTPLLLQPQSNKKWSAARGLALLTQAVQEGLDNIRISCQLHRFYGFR